MKRCLVQAEHITKEYKSRAGVVKALTDVSLKIRQGETLALVGESGCGKSTLGKILLQSVRQNEGKIIYDGKDLSSLGKEEMRQMRRRIQMIFQDPYASLDPRMSIEEIMEEPMKAFGVKKEERKKRIRELMAQTGIPVDYLKRYPHQFSGGQRQRICIARALAIRPEFVVCDEPVSALDVSIQAQILNLLKDLQKEMNLTYLFISHDLGVVHYIADRICVMFLGQICETGTREEIFTRPKHPYTKLLLESTPAVGKKLITGGEHEKAMEIPSSINPPSGCRFRTRCPYAMEMCAKEHPKLTGVADHQTACYLFAGKALGEVVFPKTRGGQR